MKSARILITACLLVATTSFTFAGPGAQYWNQRRVERARTAATAPVDARKAAESCCRVVTVQRPVASQKVSVPVRTLQCDGCAAMAAGEKCPMS